MIKKKEYCTTDDQKDKSYLQMYIHIVREVKIYGNLNFFSGFDS